MRIFEFLIGLFLLFITSCEKTTIDELYKVASGHYSYKIGDSVFFKLKIKSDSSIIDTTLCFIVNENRIFLRNLLSESEEINIELKEINNFSNLPVIHINCDAYNAPKEGIKFLNNFFKIEFRYDTLTINNVFFCGLYRLKSKNGQILWTSKKDGIVKFESEKLIIELIDLKHYRNKFKIGCVKETIVASNEVLSKNNLSY